jgi:hypothetical protein
MNQKRLEELRTYKRSDLNCLASKLHKQAAKRVSLKFPESVRPGSDVATAISRCSRPLSARPEDVLVLEEFLRSVQNH